MPDGLNNNISMYVHQREISGMKSHDCHILMQQFLPVAVRSILPKNVIIVFTELCSFYRNLCSKVGKAEDYKRLGETVALTLCKLERLFPRSFFDVLVYLNLAHEAKLAGPVQYRWMYPIGRLV